jgi:hypothetical protein
LVILGAINFTTESKAIQSHLLSIRRQALKSIVDRLKQGQRDGDVPKKGALTKHFEPAVRFILGLC